MQVDLSFGEYIRRLRRQKGLQLQDVARRSGLSTTHLSRLENDNGLPATDTVVKLHHVLDGDLTVMLELARCLPDEILDRLQGLGERGYKIGVIERKAAGDPPMLFDPGFLSGE